VFLQNNLESTRKLKTHIVNILSTGKCFAIKEKVRNLLHWSASILLNRNKS